MDRINSDMINQIKKGRDTYWIAKIQYIREVLEGERKQITSECLYNGVIKPMKFKEYTNKLFKLIDKDIEIILKNAR